MDANERAEWGENVLPEVDPVLSERRRQELKEFVMAEIHHTVRPARPRFRLPRPAILIPVMTAAAALVVAATQIIGGTPAYAITKLGDGTIHVTFTEARDPEGLREDLSRMGVNAVVDFVPSGKRCSPQPRSTSLLSAQEAPLAVPPAPQSQEENGFTIDPRVVGRGQTAVIELNVSDDDRIASIWARISNGPVAACELVDNEEGSIGPS
ncbi:hypothetical protein [Nonomuraea cavernae]|uniref:hypothetical protein n=1 Tax=Nonomuraea cavernae TaxID=2045107 RepID=UPI0033CDF2FD